MNWTYLNDRPQLVETISGKWVRVPHDFEKGTCLIELPHGLLLHVHAARGTMELYSANSEGEYVKSGTIDLFPGLRTAAAPRLERLP